MITRALLAAATIALGLTWSAAAAAYRPFDGTDADVAAPGEIELEVGPAGYHREGSERLLVLPALVFNYGVSPNLEAVLEGRQNLRLRPRPMHSSVNDVAVSLKYLARPGSLQGAHGLSVALETGVLPGASKDELGVHLASIFSQRWPALTLHLNLSNDVFASVRYEAGASLIAEGPEAWAVRPVAEILVEREFGGGTFRAGLAESLLVGAIAPCGDALSFDVALRYGRAEQRRDEELRLGLTWAFETR